MKSQKQKCAYLSVVETMNRHFELVGSLLLDREGKSRATSAASRRTRRESMLTKNRAAETYSLDRPS